MRLKDVKPGDVVAYSPRRNWMLTGFALRAIVVDVGYERRPYVRDDGTREQWQKVPGGTRVLIDVYTSSGEVVERRCVPVEHLRGRWEDVRQRVEELRAQELAAWHRRRAEQRERAHLAETLQERARAVLGETLRRDHYGVGLVVTPEQLTRLLDAYEQVHGPAGVGR